MPRTKTSPSESPPRRRMRKKYPNVALLIETTRSYGRNVLRGINDYARIRGPWLFHLPNDIPVRGLPSSDEWSGDGVIAQPRQDQEFLRQLIDSGLPVVSLSGPPGTGGLPAVRANQEAVAELAIAHFRDRGFVRFAYCGTPGEWDWPPTGQNFRRLTEEAGYDCNVYDPLTDPGNRTMRVAHLAHWLRSMKKPVGLLAQNDMRAREVLDACRTVNISVPEEIAVLGVNDDELICEMANPPLSSVIHNARRVGYEAAAMLDRLMSGKSVVADIVVDPLGVNARQSTDLLAIEDSEVAKAVRFIREHACEGIRVDDVLDEVALSRRSLEKRFRQAVGRPPHMEIRRVQLERVKQLLVTSDFKLDKIAQVTGFSTAQYLAGLFHRTVKMTPGAWRQAGRSGAK
ncbi:MAG TPA: DNA-binding transcriptional regulator [Tepidisphaeraceae bacterium]|nr:DNA-binding transcriptional regulator [Tepidisphaeraceae bacterium]